MAGPLPGRWKGAAIRMQVLPKPAKVVHGNAASEHRPSTAGRHEPGEQGGHRRPIVDEDPDITLGSSQGQGIGQGGQRAGLVVAGRQGERLHHPHLDYAAGPLLGRGRGVQPLQQPQRPIWGLFRDHTRARIRYSRSRG